MKNKGIYYTLAIILVAGIAITTCTSYFLKGSSKSETNAAYEYAAMPETGAAGGTSMEGKAEVTASEEAEEAAPEEAVSGETGSGNTEEEEPMLLSAARSGDAAPGAAAPGTAPDDLSGTAGPGQEEGAPMSGSGPGTGNTAGAETGTQKDPDTAGQKSAASSVSGEKGAGAGSGNGAGVESVVISPLETTAEYRMDGAAQNGMIKDDAAPVSSYRQRLVELDAQIQKSRENQVGSNVNVSAKNAASSELKLWDNELNLIYGEIIDRLNETQAAELVKEEREWIKERDRLAADAAKSSSGDSAESVEYTVSLAQSTRERAYELVDIYEYLLMD